MDCLGCTQQQHSTSRGSLGNAVCSCTPTSFSPHTPTPAYTATHLQDIYKPDSARLRRHLSAVINFAKFREEKLVAYTEMQGRIDELAAQAAAAQAAHDAQVGRRVSVLCHLVEVPPMAAALRQRTCLQLQLGMQLHLPRRPQCHQCRKLHAVVWLGDSLLGWPCACVLPVVAGGLSGPKLSM